MKRIARKREKDMGVFYLTTEEAPLKHKRSMNNVHDGFVGLIDPTQTQFNLTHPNPFVK